MRSSQSGAADHCALAAEAAERVKVVEVGDAACGDHREAHRDDLFEQFDVRARERSVAVRGRDDESGDAGCGAALGERRPASRPCRASSRRPLRGRHGRRSRPPAVRRSGRRRRPGTRRRARRCRRGHVTRRPQERPRRARGCGSRRPPEPGGPRLPPARPARDPVSPRTRRRDRRGAATTRPRRRSVPRPPPDRRLRPSPALGVLRAAARPVPRAHRSPGRSAR